MRKYILSRFLQLAPIFFGITFLTFGMMQFAAEDAVDVLYRQSAVSEEIKIQKRIELGLDKPFLIQYANWLEKFLSGNLGKSFISGKEVSEIFFEKLPATFELMTFSVLLTIFISVPLGIFSAVKQNKFSDYLIRFFTFVGNSLPNFFVGLLLIYFFALKFNLLPVLSSSKNFSAAILPALTLTIAMSSKYTRQIRAVFLEELDKDYVFGARARGISEIKIFFQHILRKILVVIITLLALSIGNLLGGTAIVETIFMWDGVGKLAVDAILTKDYPIIQTYVVWMSIIFVGINLIADLLTKFLNPQIKV